MDSFICNSLQSNWVRSDLFIVRILLYDVAVDSASASITLACFNLNSTSILNLRILHKWFHADWSIEFGALLNLSAASRDCRYWMHSSDNIVSFGSIRLDPFTRLAMAARMVGDWHAVKRPFGRRLKFNLTSLFSLERNDKNI